MSQPCYKMWGRLLTCGRLAIGLPGFVTQPMWGSQSWLQPAFQPAGRDCTSRAEPARKPAAGRIACPTIRRGPQRFSDLVVQALACAHFCNMDLAMSLIAIITPVYVSPEFPSRLEFFDKTVASENKLDSDGTPHL